MRTPPPTGVLAEEIREALGGATPKAIMLTTYAMEWDFTLDHVLPVFVPETMSQRDDVRRDETAAYLQTRGCDAIVYADARHIGAAVGPSRTPLTVVPVQHRTGCFHPKVTLALVEQDGRERLLVAAGSANLTMLSWMEWIECAHIRMVEDGESLWFKNDLMQFIDHLGKQEPSGTSNRARQAIQTFLTRSGQRARRSNDKVIEHFVWNGVAGREDLRTALQTRLGTWGTGATLEVVSPWFSSHGDAQIRELATSLGTSNTVVVAPRDPDSKCLVPREAVHRLGTDVTWATVPHGLARIGEGRDAAPRHLHAKLIRIFRPRQRGEMVLVGSFNLTPQAFHGQQNLEAGFLIDDDDAPGVPWLPAAPLPVSFADRTESDEDEGLPNSRPVALHLSYDWEARAGSARWDGPDPAPRPLTLRSGTVPVLTLTDLESNQELSPAQTADLQRHLLASSPLLTARNASGDELGYVIVTELNTARKPFPDHGRALSDAVAELLLDPESRRARGGAGKSGQDDDDPDTENLSTDPETAEPSQCPTGSIFDTYAALFQAMVAFEEQVQSLADDGKDVEVAHRLESEWSRCLGDVLTRAENTTETDPTMALLVAWSIEDVLARLRRSLRHHRRVIDRVLARVAALRSRCETAIVAANPDDDEMSRFLEWGRSNFGATR